MVREVVFGEIIRVHAVMAPIRLPIPVEDRTEASAQTFQTAHTSGFYRNGDTCSPPQEASSPQSQFVPRLPRNA